MSVLDAPRHFHRHLLKPFVHRRSSAWHRRSSAFPKIFFSLVVAVCSPIVTAEVTVKDAWVRGTVAAQTTTGAFMTITSSEEAKLVGARSAIAKTTEIHQSMLMDGVNHMHAAGAVALPAGKSIELKPGGYHVMLMGLAKPVAAGQKVAIELTVEDKRGKRSKIEVQAEVRPLGQ